MVRAMETAEAVDAFARRLYGIELGPLDGVLQVVAVWQDDSGYAVMKARPETPTSETGRFLVKLARARADAIVISGQTLRSAPELTYRSDKATPLDRGLNRWRTQVARRPQSPRLVVVTTGRDFPVNHPALQTDPRPLVITSSDGRERLRPATHLDVISGISPGASFRTALRLVQERGYRGISLESGPTTTRDLYDAPIKVDEVMLSVFHGGALAPAVIGGRFVSPMAIDQHFAVEGASSRVNESSGPWSFRFFRRRPE